MNIILPKSIYSAILAMSLPEEYKEKVIIKESSLITTLLKEDKSNIAFIPTLDLLKHKGLFISQKFGMSFEGSLSNAYLYFVPEQKSFNKIYLKGDLSSNDLILSKILFPELYGIEPEFILETQEIDFSTKNYLISGVENDVYPITQNGISFSEQVTDLIDLPYVNFVLVASEKENIKSFEDALLNINEKMENSIKEIITKIDIDKKLEKYILDNFETVYYEFAENDKEGIAEIIKLPYYHGIIDEIIDLNFV